MGVVIQTVSLRDGVLADALIGAREGTRWDRLLAQEAAQIIRMQPAGSDSDESDCEPGDE